MDAKITHYTGMIREYCNRYYLKGMPQELENLVNVLERIVKEPEYFLDDTSELDYCEFYDDRISVLTDTWNGKELLANSKCEEFPLIEIKCLGMDDETEEYYFFMSDPSGENKVDIALIKNKTQEI